MITSTDLLIICAILGITAFVPSWLLGWLAIWGFVSVLAYRWLKRRADERAQARARAHTAAMMRSNVAELDARRRKSPR